MKRRLVNELVWLANWGPLCVLMGIGRPALAWVGLAVLLGVSVAVHDEVQRRSTS